jgi:hypothetical protein
VCVPAKNRMAVRATVDGKHFMVVSSVVHLNVALRALRYATRQTITLRPVADGAFSGPRTRAATGRYPGDTMTGARGAWGVLAGLGSPIVGLAAPICWRPHGDSNPGYRREGDVG